MKNPFDLVRTWEHTLFDLFLLPEYLYEDWAFINALEYGINCDESLIDY